MIASLSLPQTVTWLNCPPMPILGLHLRALSLLSPPKSGWECLIKLGQAKANVKLTHTPANQVQILFRHTDIKTEVNISPQNQYFFTDPKNGPARESRSPWFLASNISARSPKKAIFLHIVVIFLHGPPKKT